MQKCRRFSGFPLLAASLLVAAPAVAEMNTSIPPSRDRALSPPERLVDDPGYELRVAVAVKIPVSNPELLRRTCRTKRSIVACTFFAAEQLRCKCNRDEENRWKVEAQASYEPVMYLRSLHYENHEQMHLEHVGSMLRLHLERVVKRTYSSESSCLAAARKEMEEFPILMNGLRAHSNRLYH